jgi:PPM family protein phosphatase
MLRIASSAVTHPGLVRETNEDSVLVTDRLVAVADGLGGHAAGEVASSIAVERMGELAERPDAGPDDVLAAIGDANRLIVQAALAHPEQAGMGTTLCGVGVVTVGGSEHCIVFNVGDSRVYSFRDGALTQVSIDHSEVQELQAAGRISAQAARNYPRRNVITRCLGSEPAPAPDLWVFPPVAHERFLVCSDGLTGEVEDDAIAALLTEHPEPGPAASALLEEAMSAGGHDNIAVIVVNLDTGSDGEPIDADTAPRARNAPGS